jgi:hypothetical protein
LAFEVEAVGDAGLEVREDLVLPAQQGAAQGLDLEQALLLSAFPCRQAYFLGLKRVIGDFGQATRSADIHGGSCRAREYP